MSNNEFQSEVLQRLTRLETLMEGALPRIRRQSRQIASLKRWRTKVIAYAGGVAFTCEVLWKAFEFARHAHA